MDNKHDKSNRTLILYFALSVIFALLSILASKVMTVTYFPSFAKITINLKWMFWLSTTLSVAFILPLISSLLSELHNQGRLPKVFGWFFRDEVVLRFVSIIRSLQSLLFSTFGRLVLAGLGIFLLTIAVWRSGVIHEMEIDSNLFTIVDATMGQHSYSKEAVFSTVELFGYLRSSDSNYLRDCLRLVRDLKSAGAKVVVLRMPNPISGKEDLVRLKELEQTGIVVFASDYGSASRFADSTGEIKLSCATVTMPGREVEETRRLVRLSPSGSQISLSYTLLDVSVEVLRKYKGYGSDMPWVQETGEFQFGEFRIPLTSEGWMYSRDRGFRTIPQFVYVDSGGEWQYSFGGARFYSREVKNPGLKIAGDRKGPTRELGTQVQGKIVLLTQSFSVSGSYLISQAYASAIENIVSNTIIKKWEVGHLWFSLVCLVIAGLVVYRVRLIVAFLILLALLPCVLLFGSYLYTTYSILIDMFYPLLSTAMAIVVYPIIAMGQQTGSRKEGFADAA